MKTITSQAHKKITRKKKVVDKMGNNYMWVEDNNDVCKSLKKESQTKAPAKKMITLMMIVLQTAATMTLTGRKTIRRICIRRLPKLLKISKRNNLIYNSMNKSIYQVHKNNKCQIRDSNNSNNKNNKNRNSSMHKQWRLNLITCSIFLQHHFHNFHCYTLLTFH